MRLHGVHRRRRGNVLVLFALSVFGIMAVAALVLDLGLARVEQARMQSACDAAALEGLWERDASGEPLRRERARERLQAAYSLVDPDDGTAQDELALGPGLAGDLQASRLLSVVEDPVWPGLSGSAAIELNLADEPEGDMVAGSYDPLGSHDGYGRTDLLPGDDAFLVRMRRVHADVDPLARIPDVSSAGPEVPLLFGAGSTIGSDPGPDGHAYRRHGITVRATAIAAARPALVAGPPAPGRPGVILAFDSTTWSALVGGVFDSSVPTFAGGRFLAPIQPLRIGEAAPAAQAPLLPDGVQVHYAAIIDGSGVVLGFGFLRVTVAGSSLTITVESPRVAAQNASAVPIGVSDLSAHAAWLGDPLARPLLAPVLVR